MPRLSRGMTIPTPEIERGEIYRKLEGALMELMRAERYLVEEGELLRTAGIARDDVNPVKNFRGFLQWSLFYERYRFYHDVRQGEIYYSPMANRLPAHVESALLNILRSAKTVADKREAVKAVEEIIRCFAERQ